MSSSSFWPSFQSPSMTECSDSNASGRLRNPIRIPKPNNSRGFFSRQLMTTFQTVPVRIHYARKTRPVPGASGWWLLIKTNTHIYTFSSLRLLCCTKVLGGGKRRKCAVQTCTQQRGKVGGGGVKFDLINMSQHRGGRLIFQNDLNIPLTYAVHPVFMLRRKGNEVCLRIVCVTMRRVSGVSQCLNAHFADWKVARRKKKYGRQPINYGRKVPRKPVRPPSYLRPCSIIEFFNSHL